MGEEMENLDDHGCHKVQDLVGEEIWICSSDQFGHKTTLHSVESEGKLFRNWIVQHLIL